MIFSGSCDNWPLKKVRAELEKEFGAEVVRAIFTTDFDRQVDALSEQVREELKNRLGKEVDDAEFRAEGS